MRKIGFEFLTIIKYIESEARFGEIWHIENGKEYISYFGVDRGEPAEIIGNIYEHPELLK